MLSGVRAGMVPNGQFTYIEVKQINNPNRSLGQQFGLALRRTIMTELSEGAETMTTLPRFRYEVRYRLDMDMALYSIQSRFDWISNGYPV